MDLPSGLHRLRLLRLLSLAPLVRCAAAVRNLRRGPRLPQAVHAKMVARVAIVDARVRCGRQPRWWCWREARGRRQLVGAAPVRRLAAVDLLRAGPAPDPLEGIYVIVPCIAVDRARRCRAHRSRRWHRCRRHRRCGRGRRGWCGLWSRRCGAPLADVQAAINLLGHIPGRRISLPTVDFLLCCRWGWRRRRERRWRRRRRGVGGRRCCGASLAVLVTAPGHLSCRPTRLSALLT